MPRNVDWSEVYIENKRGHAEVYSKDREFLFSEDNESLACEEIARQFVASLKLN